MRIHKMASLIPNMSTENFEELKADIRKHGVIEPIWTKDAKIIDGRNRYRAWTELRKEGIELPEPQFRECTATDLHDFVLSMNVIRRQLSRTQSRALIRKLLHAFPEKSDRSIARLAKVSDPTVSATRKEMENSGQLLKVSTSIGLDGKTYTRQQPVKRKAKPSKGYADINAKRIIDDLARFDLSLLVDPKTFVQELSAQVARLSAIIQ